MSLIQKSFKRLHYPTDIIPQCVRWYLAYSLSLRNLEEMMAERGITVDHSSLHRWVIRLVPVLDKAFRRYKRSVGRQWRMDESYGGSGNICTVRSIPEVRLTLTPDMLQS